VIFFILLFFIFKLQHVKLTLYDVLYNCDMTISGSCHSLNLNLISIFLFIKKLVFVCFM